MVDNVLSLSTRGLKDWLIQRVSAVILGFYSIFVIGFLVAHPDLQFDVWQMLFAHTFMKIITFLVLVSIILHAWVGIWTVFTDYITHYSLRMFLQIIVILLLFISLIWGGVILWGI